MATVKFSVLCNAVYNSKLEIPNEISNDYGKVLTYIRNHLSECNVEDLTFIDDLEPSAAVTMEDIIFIREG